MDFSKTPIDSMKQAKAYFQAMGCSSFHMRRDHSARYEEYKQLKISEATERQWTNESIEQLSRKLRHKSTKRGDLWSIHSELEELVRDLDDEDALVQIYEATEEIVPRLPKLSKLLVAETIVGRGQGYLEFRHGLIFLAADLKRRDLSKRFSEIALSLLKSAQAAKVDAERCSESIERCHKIRKRLRIK